MEKINFPQVSGQSNLIDPLHPGRYHYGLRKIGDELEQEYARRR